MCACDCVCSVLDYFHCAGGRLCSPSVGVKGVTPSSCTVNPYACLGGPDPGSMNCIVEVIVLAHAEKSAGQARARGGYIDTDTHIHGAPVDDTENDKNVRFGRWVIDVVYGNTGIGVGKLF